MESCSAPEKSGFANCAGAKLSRYGRSLGIFARADVESHFCQRAAVTRRTTLVRSFIAN